MGAVRSYLFGLRWWVRFLFPQKRAFESSNKNSLKAFERFCLEHSVFFGSILAKRMFLELFFSLSEGV